MSNWSPNSFQAYCKQNNFNDEFIKIAMEYGKNLSSKGFPVIFSLAHLVHLTDSNYSKLREVIYRKISPYGRFKIRKHSGGYRQIVIPDPFLLVVQKWINHSILRQATPHHCAQAYIKGKGIFHNATEHCSSRWMIKIDLRRFFESITEKQVYYVFLNMGYSPLVSFELARICTIVTSNAKKSRSARWDNQNTFKYAFYNQSFRIGHLPQGAPTSPMLSNLVFQKLDSDIFSISNYYGLTYTRYSDDLIFSSYDLDRNIAKQFISELSILLSKSGFRRNMNKTKVLPPGTKKIVTGLNVNSPRPKIQREMRNRIELHLYYASKFGPQEHCKRKGFKSVIGFKNHLKGLIDFVGSIDKELSVKYFQMFSTINWPEIL